MQLTVQTVHKIARLARLKVEDQEVEAMGADLTRILDWVEQLNEVATQTVEPMTCVHLSCMPMRSDHVTDGDIASQILQNAPEAQYGMFVVPKVIE